MNNKSVARPKRNEKTTSRPLGGKKTTAYREPISIVWPSGYALSSPDSTSATSFIPPPAEIGTGHLFLPTLNSDMIPRDEFSHDFDFDFYVNPLRLSDATETGGLFGLRI